MDCQNIQEAKKYLARFDDILATMTNIEEQSKGVKELEEVRRNYVIK